MQEIPFPPTALRAPVGRGWRGCDFWRYGAEANRKELEHVMRYCHEQHLVNERVKFEDIFHPSTLELTEPSE